MITDEQIRLFSQYCSENFGTELKSVRKSERYQSLPICVLDCVYSLRTKYFAVTVPVLQRYADTYPSDHGLCSCSNGYDEWSYISNR